MTSAWQCRGSVYTVAVEANTDILRIQDGAERSWILSVWVFDKACGHTKWNNYLGISVVPVLVVMFIDGMGIRNDVIALCNGCYPSIGQNLKLEYNFFLVTRSPFPLSRSVNLMKLPLDQAGRKHVFRYRILCFRCSLLQHLRFENPLRCLKLARLRLFSWL